MDLSTREAILDNLDSNSIENKVYNTEASLGLENGVLCDITGLSLTLHKTLDSFKYLIVSEKDDTTLRVYLKQKDTIMGIGYIRTRDISLLGYYVDNIGGEVYTCEKNKLYKYDMDSIDNVILNL